MCGGKNDTSSVTTKPSTWPQTQGGSTVSDTMGHMTHATAPQTSLRYPRMHSSLTDSLSYRMGYGMSEGHRQP